MTKLVPLIAILPMVLSACYSAPEVPGFDQTEWLRALQHCGADRMAQARHLLSHFETIKNAGQHEIQNLLGKPDRHELFVRNQKFFFYKLNCESDSIAWQLSLRFDALGALREGLIEQKMYSDRSDTL